VSIHRPLTVEVLVIVNWAMKPSFQALPVE
jgi:hypothetical protein